MHDDCLRLHTLTETPTAMFEPTGVKKIIREDGKIFINKKQQSSIETRTNHQHQHPAETASPATSTAEAARAAAKT